jgi:SAM-dependent methyltransferase
MDKLNLSQAYPVMRCSKRHEIRSMSNDGSVKEQLQAWSIGVPSETAFWKDWIETRGGQWPQDFIDRLDPNRLMNADHAEVIKSIKRKKIDILDVGSGPFTWLGKRVPGIQINLRACDPLAEVYDELLTKSNVVPPVKTEFAPAEDLLWAYRPASFDFVHIRNALDHSFDPMRGIMQMLTLCRPGGYVVLSHFANEAEREFYQGFHQWNFDKADGKFVLWNKSEKVIVSDHTKRYAKETSVLNPATDSGPAWIEVKFKRNSVPMPKPALKETTERANEILKFFVSQSSGLNI